MTRRLSCVLRTLAACSLTLGACATDDGSASAQGTDTEGSSGGTVTGTGIGTETTTSTSDPTASAASSASTASTTQAETESVTEGSSGIDTDTTGGDPQDTICNAFETLLTDLEAAADNEARVGLANTFIRDAQYSDAGIPLLCGDELIFLTLQASDTTIAVAGEFNDWNPDAVTFAPAVDGFALQYAAVATPRAPGLYKFVFDGGTYLADPLARRFGWDENGEYSLTGARDEASHLERWPDLEPVSGNVLPRNITVYVPAGTFQTNDLATLYMHDGQNLFDPGAFFGGWEANTTADALIANGGFPPFLIIGIDNTDQRFDEYTHTEDVIDTEPVGGQGDEYGLFVVEDLLPFIEARYPVSTNAASRGVVGSSLGGLISLFIGQLHPNVFGFIGSMSGTLGWGTFGLANPVMEDLYAAQPPSGVRIYVDSGGNGPCPNGGSDNYCSSVEFATGLRELGWTDEVDLFYRWAPNEPHNEAAWSARFEPMLRSWSPPR